MEALLNSTVVTAGVTGLFALLGTISVYLLSRKVPTKTSKSKATIDPKTYSGYEGIITQERALNDRLNASAIQRETEMAALRHELEQAYRTIRHKDDEISKLKHARLFIERANEIKR